MMKLKGAVVAAVMFGGGLAFAQDQPQPEPLPMGSDAAVTSTDTQETELTGTVIRAETEEETLYVRNEQGESVQLKIDDQTRFEDPSVRRLEDLSAGQEVRASYAVEGGENVASTISLKEDKAMGGSGDEGIDSGMREKDQTPPPPVTPEPGTGGSGEAVPDAGTYPPMPDSTQDIGGSGLEDTGTTDPNRDMNEPVDMQQ